MNCPGWLHAVPGGAAPALGAGNAAASTTKVGKKEYKVWWEGPERERPRGERSEGRA